jgi:hypothetical protein
MRQRNEEEEEEEGVRGGREGVGGTTGEFTTGNIFHLLGRWKRRDTQAGLNMQVFGVCEITSV